MNKIKDRKGEIGKNRFGTKMEIIEYQNYKNIVVEFKDLHKHKVRTAYNNFERGHVRNPYDKSVCSVGYLGVGIYSAGIGNKIMDEYSVWVSMMKRCYSKKFQKRFPAYKGCTVVSEWHNFQNFGEWYTENYYEIDGEGTELDKDILIKGNKIYGPETCIFVPQKINNLFPQKSLRRSEYYMGITFHKINEKFVANCGGEKNKKQQYLGSFDTQEEAFCAYKKYKENLIRKIANEYKTVIPTKLFESMMNYRVEING